MCLRRTRTSDRSLIENALAPTAYENTGWPLVGIGGL